MEALNIVHAFLNINVMGWKSVSPPNTDVEILPYKVKVVESGPSENWLDHERRILMSGMSALIKWPKSSLCVLHHVRMRLNNTHLKIRNKSLQI
jgi:hypothetical protein